MLTVQKLNSSFNGGVSSYCLFLLILAFIRYQYFSNVKIQNIEILLMDFLFFYGKIFDYKLTIIDLKYRNPYIQKEKGFEKLSIPIIIDPIYNFNAGKNCFRMDLVTNFFAETYDYLNTTKGSFDGKTSILADFFHSDDK